LRTNLTTMQYYKEYTLHRPIRNMSQVFLIEQTHELSRIECKCREWKQIWNL